MRVLKSLLVMTAVVGLVAVMEGRSFADILPPFPSSWNPGDKVAGQSTLYVTSGTGLPITVDWIVVYWGNVGPSGKPVWGYYYQLENPEAQAATKTIAIFTVNTPYAPFFDAGFIADQSLDVNFVDIGLGSVPGHNPSNYPLAGETEPSPGTVQNPTTTPSLSTTDVTFFFGPSPTTEIAVGNQSAVLIGYAFAPPTYYTGQAQDSDVQWKGKVPVPSPEPGAAVLLMMGLMGIGVIRWSRKNSQRD